MSSDRIVVSTGDSYPLGAHPRDGGVNFSLYSSRAQRVELLLFDAPESELPTHVIELSPPRHGAFHYWHCHVAGVGPGQLYGWRVDGPFDPATGDHFDATKLLLDPYGRAIGNTKRYRRGEGVPQDYSRCLKSVVATPDYDWEGDRPLERPFGKTVIYEMHVRGFTRHESSGLGDDLRGTYRGLVEKIDYLVDLGVTAVELLPVFQFDRFDAPRGKQNYWGYSPISFFAPHGGYASAGDGLAAIDEFRGMVKALHRAGIEVILDVVYNHTNEGGARGITQSLRGIDNQAYYILEEDGAYANYSGCGNTINANASVVRRLILDSLRYWVQQMHVDGFRFDLASILSRDEAGVPMASPPLLWDIETDPVLVGTKLIAEAWDAAGLYQVGEFFGHHWKEWNGKFRDDVRSFVRATSAGSTGGGTVRKATRAPPADSRATASVRATWICTLSPGQRVVRGFAGEPAVPRAHRGHAEHAGGHGPFALHRRLVGPHRCFGFSFPLADELLEPLVFFLRPGKLRQFLGGGSVAEGERSGGGQNQQIVRSKLCEERRDPRIHRFERTRLVWAGIASKSRQGAG